MALPSLGPLHSSDTVLIFATLISPLVGPIVRLGFSLCVVDLRMMGRVLLALPAGVRWRCRLPCAPFGCRSYARRPVSPLHASIPTLSHLLAAFCGGWPAATR